MIVLSKHQFSGNKKMIRISSKQLDIYLNSPLFVLVPHCRTWWSGPLLCMACMSQPQFLFLFKTEELVHSGLCAVWYLRHDSLFLSARIKILLWNKNKQMLYLWLLEITKVRIRFQNYLFKADKIISHHLWHNRIFSADRLRILPWKINRLLLHFWLLEITQVIIRLWNYLFQADKSIQNLSGGYNLNLDNIFVYRT